MKRNGAGRNTDSLENAFNGSPVSRRWLLRNSANAAAGVIAVSAFGQGAESTHTEPAKEDDGSHKGEQAVATNEPAGYVHSLHGWDTI